MAAGVPSPPSRAELTATLREAERLMRRLDVLHLWQEAAHVSMAVEMLRWAAWWRPPETGAPEGGG